MAKTNEELLERTRENAVEMALRERLQRQFGSYTIDGAEGIIGRQERCYGANATAGFRP